MNISINFLVLFLFMTITFIVGMNHEPWADEAQAWLIARDCSFSEIFFSVSKSEGTPILWHLILKFLQFFNLPYEKLFLVPFFCSSIGVYLLLFKSKLPNYIKFLFPFSYFPLYQYGVIARSYSLILLIFSLLAILYKDRYKKPYIYSLFLCISASIAPHLFFVSCFLIFCFIYEYIKKFKFTKRTFWLSFLFFTYIIFTISYVKQDNTFNYSYFNFANLIERMFFDRLFFCYSEFYTNNKVINLIFILCFYILNMFYFCKKNIQKIFFISINIFLLFILTVIYSNIWHCGHLFFILIFTIWIFSDENKLEHLDIKKQILLFICWIIVLIPEIYYCINSSIYDIKNTTSSSQIIQEIIKKNNLTQFKIAGLGFRTVSIQPYFKTNIFGNYNNKKAYWDWKEQYNNDTHLQTENSKYDIIIYDENEKELYEKFLPKNLENYNIYKYYSYLPIKIENENTSLIIYTNKNDNLLN